MADVDRAEFYERVNEVLNDKTSAPNAFIFTASKYSRLMQQVKEAKIKTKKLPRDYRLVKRYDIMVTPDGERLVMSKMTGQKPQIFLRLEEMYDVIHDHHLKLNHGGRSRMMVELKPKYKNITTRMVMLYLSLCQECKSKVKRTIPAKIVPSSTEETGETFNSSKCNTEMNETRDDPLETSKTEDNYCDMDTCDSSNSQSDKTYPELFSRGQFDIIDVTTSKDEPYRHLLIYRDLVTRFIHLKPLKSTKIDECVDALLEIFLVFGAPNILQSKNGISVTNQICRRMYTLFPDFKVVSAVADLKKQNFKRQTNEDVLKLLGDWLKQNTSQKWHQGVKYVQYLMNNTFIEVICRTPSESLLGRNPKRGLASFMSKDEYNHVSTEEELKFALEEKESGKNEQLLLEETLIPSDSFIKVEAEEYNIDDNEFP